MKSQSRKKQCMIFRKGMCMKWPWRCKPGTPALRRWRPENQEFKVVYRQKRTASEPFILFFSPFSIYFGFFKAIFFKKKKPIKINT